MSVSDTEELKARVQEFVDANAERLIEISHTIHAHPEIAFEEYESMALLADTAEAAGFDVTRGVAGLETAFVGVADVRAAGSDGGVFVGVRCAAGDRPCVRAQHYRHGGHGRGAGCVFGARGAWRASCG